MSDERGGVPSHDEHLAPVIPLFGMRVPGAAPVPRGPGAAVPTPAMPSTEAEWRSTWAEESAAERRGPGPRHPAAALSGERAAAASPAERRALHAVGRHEGEQAAGEDPVDAAREILVRRLRAKQLSNREAIDVLREHDVSAEDRDAIIAEFEQRGYLDDAS
ncbi:MAG: hypothetical protein JST25_08660, partial [Actinobacteria bacterium]|nr:hypothetical protein [Actinomycetota bacterium]